MGSIVSHMESMQYAAAVAANVDRKRKAAGMSVLALSEVTGIPYTTLSRRLGPAPDFTSRELKAIADALGTTALELATVRTLGVAA